MPAEDCFTGSLQELIRLRVAQLMRNQTAVIRHASELHALGEDPERVTNVSRYAVSECYSAGEQAALAWTELLCVHPEHASPGRRCHLLGEHFSESDQAALTVLIVAAQAADQLDASFGKN